MKAKEVGHDHCDDLVNKLTVGQLRDIRNKMIRMSARKTKDTYGTVGSGLDATAMTSRVLYAKVINKAFDGYRHELVAGELPIFDKLIKQEWGCDIEKYVRDFMMKNKGNEKVKVFGNLLRLIKGATIDYRTGRSTKVVRPRVIKGSSVCGDISENNDTRKLHINDVAEGFEKLDWDNLKASAMQLFDAILDTDDEATSTGMTTVGIIVTGIVLGVDEIQLENCKKLFNKESRNERVTIEFVEHFGYQLLKMFVNANDCSVPQGRERMFLKIKKSRLTPSRRLPANWECENQTLNEKYQTVLKQLTMQTAPPDAFEFTKSLLDDFPCSKVLKNLKAHTGLHKGKEAQWIKKAKEMYDNAGLDWATHKFKNYTEQLPSEIANDLHFCQLSGQGQCIVKVVDAVEGLPHATTAQFIDEQQGLNRYILHSNTVPSIVKKTKLWYRNDRVLMDYRHNFAYQGYNIDDFPQAKDTEITHLYRMIGDAVCGTVYATMELVDLLCDDFFEYEVPHCSLFKQPNPPKRRLSDKTAIAKNPTQKLKRTKRMSEEVDSD
jgi:site-specific DNA-cytosine methylase